MSVYRAEQGFDFDVWVMTCLLCGQCLTPEGEWHVGSVTLHMREAHGLVFQTCDPEEGTRRVDGDGQAWSRTYTTYYRSDFGRGERVLFVQREYGMGIAEWHRRLEASESHSTGRKRVRRYRYTGGYVNVALRPVQPVLWHVRERVTT